MASVIAVRRGDQVAFGRDFEREQPFLARQIRSREVRARLCGFDLGAKTGGVATFDHRDHLTAPHAFAEIAVERDDTATDRRGDNLRCLRIAFDRGGQAEYARAACCRTNERDPGCRDLFCRQMDFAFGFGFFCSCLFGGFGGLLAASCEDECEGERQGRPVVRYRFSLDTPFGGQLGGQSPEAGRRIVVRRARVDRGAAGVEQGPFGIEQDKLVEFALGIADDARYARPRLPRSAPVRMRARP